MRRKKRPERGLGYGLLYDQYTDQTRKPPLGRGIGVSEGSRKNSRSCVIQISRWRIWKFNFNRVKSASRTRAAKKQKMQTLTGASQQCPGYIQVSGMRAKGRSWII